MEFIQILNLKNKDFAETCVMILRELNLSDENMEVLLNVEKTNNAMNGRYSFTYPILKEVPMTGSISYEMRLENGNPRYYPKRYFLNGKAYLLCNDWYYPLPHKKNVKDNRTPFLNWIFQIKAMK